MGTMQPYFRDAVTTDIPAIGAILRSSGPTGTDGTSPVGSYRDALAEIDRTDGNYVLVAEYDSQIVAVLQLFAYRHLHERGGRTAQIVMMRVAEEFRTSGVGGMLVDHAVERARDLGCRFLETRSATSAANEHHEWERSGFVHLDRGYVLALT